MANLRDIRTRIKSVKNTRQITRAMQLVAASKMKRAQEKAQGGRSYTFLLAQILVNLSGQESIKNHPFFNRRAVNKRGIAVISTDKGLCGGLNANLFKKIISIKEDVVFISIGRKGKQFLTRTQRPLLASFEVADLVPFHQVRIVVDYMIEKFIAGEIDTVEVLYPEFINTLTQEATIAPILPIHNLGDMLVDLEKKGRIQLPEKDPREIIFEPSVGAILDEIPAIYAKQSVYQLILEARASEHSARMVAMKSATDNASKFVDSLTLEYNKARQAAITQEILELAASAA